MKTIQVLMIRPNNDSKEELNRSFGKGRLALTHVNADEAAVEQFCQRQFDVVVIGKGWGESDRKRINTLANKMAAGALLIRQENDNVEELKSRIEEAYTARQRASLHHIKVNDTLDSENLAKDIQTIASEEDPK